ncbi:MAG: GNAT family N-acetyltransferase [Renibacterium sp.]|nr:GNAT family N-acetyltransferase [Renibacterium sp.]
MTLPGREQGLEFRPITEADLAAWYELVLRISEAEKPPWHDQPEDLANALSSAKNDPRQNTLLGLDESGVPRAFGRVSKNPGGDKAHVFGGVDPQWQRRGIGSAVLGWQLRQVARRFAEQGQSPARARGFLEADNAAQRALYAAHGFEVVRYFSEMRRPLAEAIPDIELAPDLQLARYRPEQSEAVRLAHNAAFADHWGSEPRDAEAWANTVGHPQFRADWSSVVLDAGSGDVVGYQLASYDDEVLTNFGRREGYTELLGVRREYRGRWIAAALLADALQRFAEAGMDYAALDVDTESPTGAVGLYDRMGYRPTHRSMALDRVL